MSMRAGLLGLAALSLAACGGSVPSRSANSVEATRLNTVAPLPGGFQRWIADFRARALSQGISAPTLERALAGIAYNEDSIRRDQHQPEFTRPIWAYLDSAVSDTRIENGRQMLREHDRLLGAIEAAFGVEREIVVAVWGLESSYGRLRGTTPIIGSLATLAYEGRRAAFFEQQLIAALRIIEAGDVAPESMTGSWAGAMGHTQFIPTSYLEYAVDFNGDGRRDIWSDDPTDSLASTAAYLARFGWTRGQPALVEVSLPQGFDRRLVGDRRAVQDWAAMGLRPQGGARLPATGEATLFLPAGTSGPAMLTFANFRVIKRYNNADAYAIAIAHLADRLRGAGPFVGNWPRDDRPLNAEERAELQRMLTRSGHYRGEIDGRVGSGTLEAVRGWQVANGLAPDGYVSLALLQRMRRR